MLTEHSRWIWIDFNRDPITNSEHKDPYIYLIQIAINFSLFPNGSMSIPSALKWISSKTKWINLHTYRHRRINRNQNIPCIYLPSSSTCICTARSSSWNPSPSSSKKWAPTESCSSLSEWNPSQAHPWLQWIPCLIESPLRNPIILLEAVMKTTTGIVCKKDTIIGCSKVVSWGNCNSGG